MKASFKVEYSKSETQATETTEINICIKNYINATLTNFYAVISNRVKVIKVIGYLLINTCFYNIMTVSKIYNAFIRHFDSCCKTHS